MTGVSDAPLDFVIIGAQRAGSTHLNASLHTHPEVFLCPDEVPYFEERFFSTTPPSVLRSVFAEAAPGQRLGIQRPEYLAAPGCARRIQAVAPDARILAVLREPVSRAVSAYFWYVQFGLLPLAPLDVGMARLLDGWADPAYPRAADILEYGLYGTHLRSYLEVFGPRRVLVLRQEDLRVAATFGRVYQFLGVAADHPVPTLGRTTNAGVYDRRRLRVLRARRRFVWSWDSETTYSYRPRRLRRPFSFVPNAAVVGFDRMVLARLLGNRQPSVPPDLEARLCAFYADDLRLAESLLDLDLSAWRRPAGQPAPS
ncbi:MAG TPA: sulfotransferase [Acidimicrobiales bacterium]|nr:sulfotransferase [Acidimicrobiales bacterium]